MATQPVSSFDKLIADLESQRSKANEENQKRLDQMTSIFDEVINRYQPGGAFQKAGLAQIGQQKVTDVGKETQQMIGSGLYGTTTTASLPSRWESQVGNPARLNLEDVMMQRLSGAQISKAGMIERVEDTGPSISDIINMANQYGQGRTTSNPMPSYNPTGSSSSPGNMGSPGMFADSGGYSPPGPGFVYKPTGGAPWENGTPTTGTTPTTVPTTGSTTGTKPAGNIMEQFGAGTGYQPSPQAAPTAKSITRQNWTGSQAGWEQYQDAIRRAGG